MSDRPAYQCCIDVVNAIVKRLDLNETLRRPLTSSMSPSPIGELVSWAGDSLDELVYIGLSVPPIGLDSHMLFAFTPGESLTPHFTLDSVMAGGNLAFHLDLIPRTDLAVNVGYMTQNYGALTESFEAAREIEGLDRAHLSPMQLAVMSPWMLAHRATEEAFTKVNGQVQHYLEHWFGLVKAGHAEHVGNADHADFASNQAIRDRDLLHRSVLFSAEIDKVWVQMDRLLGETQSR